MYFLLTKAAGISPERLFRFMPNSAANNISFCPNASNDMDNDLRAVDLRGAVKTSVITQSDGFLQAVQLPSSDSSSSLTPSDWL